MIACLAKNKRGRPLFEQLAAIDPSYCYLGEPKGDRKALLRGFISSIGPDFAAAKRDARFSPAYLSDLSQQCIAMIDRAQSPPEAVLYWGATNLPIDPDRHNIPLFIVTDGPFDPEDPTYPVEWKPQRWARTYFEAQHRVFETATHIFTLSEWARRKVIQVHGQSESKVSKCGWGPIGSFGPPRLDPVPGRPLFLSVGSEWKRKGMDVLADAGSKLHQERNYVETIIAGTPVDLSIEPRAGLSLLPYAVPAPIVHALMREASCLVLAARFDASPHVIFEALQYGTPVIATRTCGVPEAIIDGVNGFLIDGPEPELLLQAMRRFLDSDESQLRRGAYDSYERSGGWRAVADHVRETIARVI
jgi:glycosyltransferase involved in cell wall biosynthesis